MKEIIKIEVEGVEVNLHFRFSTLYKLGEKWGLSSVNDVVGKVGKVCVFSAEDITIDALEVLSDLVMVCADKPLDRLDVIDSIGSNPRVIVEIIELLMKTIISPGNIGAVSKTESNLGK